MSTGNPAPGVGGTARDGGLLTVDTVADGGPSKQDGGDDGEFVPEGEKSTEKPFTKSEKNAKTSNPAPGVGGTAQDGGLSTKDTISDGGPDAGEDDPTYKPT